jgi:hypothetical protein
MQADGIGIRRIEDLQISMVENAITLQNSNNSYLKKSSPGV